MTEVPENTSLFQPSKTLIKILRLGGRLSVAPEKTSYMLNGLQYYSLELTLDEDSYYIQAFEEEAIELCNLVKEIHRKVKVIK